MLLNDEIAESTRAMKCDTGSNEATSGRAQRDRSQVTHQIKKKNTK